MSTINRTMTVYAQEALNQFVDYLAPLNVFSSDYSAEAVAKGSAVAVPLVEAITSTTFNQTYTGTGGTINTVTVTLDQHRINTVDLTDVQQLNSDTTMARFGKQQGKSLAKIVLQDIFSVLTETNFGAAAVTTASTNFDKDQVRTMRKALAEDGIRPGGLVVDPTAFDALLGDTNIVQAYAFGGSEAIREAKIPRLLGMEVHECGVIPANSITLYGFMAHPNAIAVAMRRFDAVVPDGEYEYFDFVQDDETGIGMQVRVLYNKLTGKRHGSCECLFGYSKALTLGIELATSDT